MSVEFIQANDDGLRTRAATFGLDGSFTVGCWVKTGSTLDTHSQLISKPTGGGELAFGVWNNGSNLRLTLVIEGDTGYQAGQAAPADSLPAGVWAQAFATYDDAADEVEYYVNGVLLVIRTRTTVMTETSTALHIARRSAAQEYEGHILDAAIWNRLLTLAEIASLYNGRLVAGFIPSGLTGWWPLHVPGDSGWDEAVASGDLGLQDFSGRGNPADETIEGNPDWRADTPGLHWPSGAMVIPASPPGGGAATRRVSLGATFIDADRVVLAG